MHGCYGQHAEFEYYVLATVASEAPAIPHAPENAVTSLEHQSSTLGLLVTTAQLLAKETDQNDVQTYPSSKCLQRLSASCALVLHEVHSNRSTTFFVVFAFL